VSALDRGVEGRDEEERQEGEREGDEEILEAPAHDFESFARILSTWAFTAAGWGRKFQPTIKPAAKKMRLRIMLFSYELAQASAMRATITAAMIK
jgi:hypothetical protein